MSRPCERSLATMAKSASATALPSSAACVASVDDPKTRVRLSSKSSTPAACIDIGALEVAHLVGDIEAQLDARLLPAKIVDAPHQPLRRELRVERHLQQRRAARRLARAADGTVEQVERIDRRLVKHVACFSQ